MAATAAARRDAIEPKTPAAFAAELLGTFVLVLVIGLVLANNTTDVGGGIVAIGLLHAFVLTMLVAALGGTSGAHFNPAVTVTLAVLRKISPADAVIYIILQLIGAVLAALVVGVTLGEAADASNFGAAAVTANGDLITGNGGAFLAELIGTFALMLAIMGVAVNPRAERSVAPWVIGATLGFAVIIIGPLTGAGLNPARAFGPALIGDAFGGFGDFLFIYVAGPIVGALLAGLIYSTVVLGQRGLTPAAPSDTLER